MAPRPLKDADYQRLAEFRYQLRRFLAFSEDQARDAGLTPQQHQFLLVVRGCAPEAPNIGLLAERLILRHNSTVELADRLEDRGLLVRVRDVDDKRQAHVHLTKEGEALLHTLSSAHHHELRRAGRDLFESLRPLLDLPPSS